MQDLIATFEVQFSQQHFIDASATLQELLLKYPDDPQLQILQGRLYDVTGKTEAAEAIFRRLLKSSLPARLIAQARQGLLAIEMAEVSARQAKIDAFLKLTGGSSLAYLAILPVTEELKSLAIAKVARIFRTDPYTARFKIPNRYPKIIRTGTFAEMQAYGKDLQSYGIGAIWLSIEAIAQIPVYTVEYFSQFSISQPSNLKFKAIAGSNEISFEAEDVISRVEGILPTFGEVVVVNAKHKLVRKQQILDRVHICDLHLRNYTMNGERLSGSINSCDGCILRFHDSQYRFELGLNLSVERSLQHIAPTVQEHWTELAKWLDQSMPSARIAKDFQAFAEMSLTYPEFLEAIADTYITLERTKPSLWDNCFQLYSSTVFYHFRN